MVIIYKFKIYIVFKKIINPTHNAHVHRQLKKSTHQHQHVIPINFHVVHIAIIFITN